MHRVEFLVLFYFVLISGSKDTTIRLWNTSSSFSLINTLYYHEDSVNSLLVTPNQTLISGSCDKKIAQKIKIPIKHFRCSYEIPDGRRFDIPKIVFFIFNN